MNPRSIDLDKLNTVTKYPSIETFHTIGDRGRLKEELRQPLPPDDRKLYATEKVDGANCRIVVFPSPDGGEPTFIIGSREEFLTARGDLIFNRVLGIVEAARPWAEGIVRSTTLRLSTVMVYFVEVYGGELPEARRYTGNKASGVRLFDVMAFEPGELAQLLHSNSIEQLAAHRDHGGPKFLDFTTVERLAESFQLPLVPHFELASRPPQDVRGTYEWLREILPGPTKVALDGTPGKPEGLVLRTVDRKFICKVRFEDYERTLRPNKLPVRVTYD